MGRKSRRGQVLSEYAIMMAMFAAVSIVLLLVLAAFTEYGFRMIYLVSIHDEVSIEGWD